MDSYNLPYYSGETDEEIWIEWKQAGSIIPYTVDGVFGSWRQHRSKWIDEK